MSSLSIIRQGGFNKSGEYGRMTARRRYFGISIAPCVLAMVTSFSLAGCGGSREDTSPVNRGVTLQVGESSSIGDDNRLQLTLSQVIEDTRCGINESCVLGGRVRANLAISETGAAAQTLTIAEGVANDIAPSDTHPGYRIEIVDTKPVKRSITEIITQEKYHLKLLVRQLP